MGLLLFVIVLRFVKLFFFWCVYIIGIVLLLNFDLY